MRKLKPRRTVAVASAALALAAGGGAAIAMAESSSPSAAANPPAVAKDDQDQFLAALAKHLGVTTAALEDAIKAAAIDRVDAAVAAGRLTQAQADAIKSRIESGQLPLLGGHRLGGLRGGMHGFGAETQAVADYLGLSLDQLREKVRSGQSLAEIATAQGKSVDGLKQAMVDAAKAQLDRAVSDGRLSADQAKAILDQLQSRIDDIVNRSFQGRRGGWRHFGAPPAGARFSGHAPQWSVRA